MRQLDLKQLAAKVSVEHGIRVDPDDPIMAVVTLNRLVLEQAANEIIEEVRSATREFERAATSVQARAGNLVAHEVRGCVAVLRHEVQKELANSPARPIGGVEAAGQARVWSGALPWVAIGLLLATALFSCGLWLGTRLR
jgi:hypothetical protein